MARAAGTIRGAVMSDGEPIPFANVLIVGTRVVTMTDTAGRFTLRSNGG